jgi:glycosyltransferase involved in cell wall biosynthesis
MPTKSGRADVPGVRGRARRYERGLDDIDRRGNAGEPSHRPSSPAEVCAFTCGGVNRGIESASGRLITILDDDNLWEPDHLENIVNNFNGADLSYTGVRIQTLTPDGQLMEERVHYLPFDFGRLLKSNFIFTVATAFRRALWDEVGRYDERFPVYEDWEFLIRATHQREVRALTTYSAISRAFTGDVHLREHSANEPDACARCRTALQWKHRHLRNQRVHDFNVRLLGQWWWQNHFGVSRA